MRRWRSIFWFIGLLVGAPADAAPVAIVNAHLNKGDGSPSLEGATVLIHNGRIVASGKGVNIPANARIVNAESCWVTPGLIAANTTLGLSEVSADDAGNDIDSRQAAFSAALSVADSINPAATDVSYYRAHGITRALVHPGRGSTIFRGLGAVISTRTDSSKPYLANAFLLIELGEGGANVAGGSRAAALAFLRVALAEASDPRLRVPTAHETPGHLPAADLDVVRRALNGEIPVVVLVERRSDIRVVLALRALYPRLLMTIAGASEAWLEAATLRSAGVAVIGMPLSNLPVSFERLASSAHNLPRLARAGVTIAVGEPGRPADTRQAAAQLVALDRLRAGQGLDWGQALASITVGPAKALALDHDIGTLLPGRRADLVIWDGDPLQPGSGPIQLFIDGIEQTLETRQTLLRQRYSVGSDYRRAQAGGPRPFSEGCR